MATRKESTLKREPEPGTTSQNRRTGLERRDIEDEDPEAVREDDASEFLEDEDDDYPGDRRRDPLRQP